MGVTQAVLIEKPGGPEKLSWRQRPLSRPGRGEVRIRQTAVGLNFIDVYHRTGLYPLPSYPAALGKEACGVVEACGPQVADFKPGDRVAYCHGPLGAYTEARIIGAHYLVKIPDGISDVMAASALLKGLTAYYLLHHSYVVRAGDTVLVHAAAGGVGLLLCQWAKLLGVRVIGTVGSPKKAAIAKEHGCDEVIEYGRENFARKVRALTGGEGVEAVYDSVGKDTFLASLDCLRPFGTMVSFGQSSGAVAPFDTGLLAQKGSLFLTRPTLMDHLHDVAAYRYWAAELFALLASGGLALPEAKRYALKDAAQAHRDLEGRKTSGAAVLIP